MDAPFRIVYVDRKRILWKRATFTTDTEIDKDEVDVGSCTLRWRNLRRGPQQEKSSVVDSVGDAHTLIQSVWPLESITDGFFGRRNVELFVASRIDWREALGD